MPPKAKPKSHQPRTKPAPSPSNLPRPLFACAALAVLVLIAYANSLSNGFVWDDHQQIVLNPALKPDAPISPLFTTDARFAAKSANLQTRDYRPLQLLSYRLLLNTFGPEPTAFHVSNLLFALAVTLAAFAVFWLLTRRYWIAFAAAALFAVHPVHTETVDWIAALPDLGFSLFVFLAFALFLLARTATRRAVLLLALSVAAFAFALLWKESAIVFPALIALYVLLEDRSPRTALTRSAPYWAVLAAYLALRLFILGSLATGPRDWALTPPEFALNALNLMLAYWAKLAIPIPLNAYTVFHPIRSFADPRAILTLALSLAGFAAIAWLVRRRASLALFSTGWVIVTLLPAMDINALGRNPFTERYLYLASAGFCLLVTLAAAQLLNRLPSKLHKPATASFLLLAVAAYTTETIARNPDWKDDATLFAETLQHSPDAPFIRIMVAENQSSDSSHASEYSAAEENFLQAITFAQREQPPDRVDTVIAYQGLASIYADRSNLQLALNTLAQARQIDPNNADTEGEEGILLARAGRGIEAEPLLEKTLAAQPNNENVLTALGLIAHDDLHNLPRADAFFTRALALHTQNDDFAASLHNNLGAVYADQGDLVGAITQIRLATQILATDPGPHINLATLLASAGQYDEARSEAELALRLAPNNPAADDLLARLNKQTPKAP